MDFIIYIIGLLQTINKSYRAEGKLLTERRTDRQTDTEAIT